MTAAKELQRLPAGDPDPDRGPRRIVGWMIATVLVFMVVAVVWSAFAQLDVAVNARGQVVPPSRLQEVQSLEGGIVKEMLVAAGQPVKKGQLIARLDSAQYDASLGESRHYRLAALAGQARMEALLSGGPPRFDADWTREAPDLVAKEMQLWRDAQREYSAALAAAGEGVQRRRSEIDETAARIRSLDVALKVGEESFAIEERLFKAGAGSRADYLAAQQRLLALRTELEGLQQSLPRLRAGLAEAQAAASEVDARFRAQWGAQRNEFRTKAAALDSTLMGQEDLVQRREITSPVDGVVNRVHIQTLGGVAQPGRPIVDIVPDEAELLMTVRVRPSDIGFIHVGQNAKVSVLTYDSAVYGRLEAEVQRVGADAVVDEKTGEAYFEVQLVSTTRALTYQGRTLPITSGMPVDAGILTGERSVLQYMLKPVLRGLQTSLQER
jgi:membrane fusion protein, adhesin transport system